VAQVEPATVLAVQAENFVAYVGDVSDVLKDAVHALASAELYVPQQ